MGDIGSRQVRFEVLPMSGPWSGPCDHVDPAQADLAAGAPADDAQRPIEHERSTVRAEPARS